MDTSLNDVTPPRMLRLARIEEETHHWYEESDFGRHLPQIVAVDAIIERRESSQPHAVGW